MLSISSIKGDAGYYSHEDNYYASGSLDSRWMGEGAEKLGLKGKSPAPIWMLCVRVNFRTVQNSPVW